MHGTHCSNNLWFSYALNKLTSVLSVHPLIYMYIKCTYVWTNTYTLLLIGWYVAHIEGFVLKEKCILKKNILIYRSLNLTKFIALSIHWKDTSCTATQEIPSNICNHRANFLVHKRHSLVPIPSQIQFVPPPTIFLRATLTFSIQLRLSLLVV
jgi:hypothetical protein